VPAFPSDARAARADHGCERQFVDGALTMRLIALALSLAALAVVAGCSSSLQRPDPGYAAYLEFVGQQSAREDARIAGIAAAAQSCTDSRCVEHVAAMAALAAGGGAGGALPAPPPRQPTKAETFARVVGAISPIAATLVTGAVQWHQADTSRDVSIAQYGTLDHVLSGAVTGMAGAVPSITVGGDYITGDPVTVGGDQVGGDQYQGPVAGGDQRWDSPGPLYGPICTGEGCQPQPPVTEDPAGP
jgi:hypothetical protein